MKDDNSRPRRAATARGTMKTTGRKSSPRAGTAAKPASRRLIEGAKAGGRRRKSVAAPAEAVSESTVVAEQAAPSPEATAPAPVADVPADASAPEAASTDTALADGGQDRSEADSAGSPGIGERSGGAEESDVSDAQQARAVEGSSENAPTERTATGAGDGSKAAAQKGTTPEAGSNAPTEVKADAALRARRRRTPPEKPISEVAEAQAESRRAARRKTAPEGDSGDRARQSATDGKEPTGARSPSPRDPSSAADLAARAPAGVVAAELSAQARDLLTPKDVVSGRVVEAPAPDMIASEMMMLGRDMITAGTEAVRDIASVRTLRGLIDAQMRHGMTATELLMRQVGLVGSLYGTAFRGMSGVWGCRDSGRKD